VPSSSTRQRGEPRSRGRSVTDRDAEITRRLNEVFADSELAEEQRRTAAEWAKVGTDWRAEKW
jgi:hypothetical protein